MKTNGGHAFPGYEHVVVMDRNDPEKAATVMTQQPHGGMSLRDYFAAAALTSVLSNLADMASSVREDPGSCARFARDCYRQADAMLAEREK